MKNLTFAQECMIEDLIEELADATDFMATFEDCGEDMLGGIDRLERKENLLERAAVMFGSLRNTPRLD